MAKEPEIKEPERLPAFVTEFIGQLLKKMRYRRKVRREVGAELATHFSDELKDCADEAKKEEKARRLIGEFGEIKMLAVLLRRAKRRCRPTWRTVFARSFQAVGVLFLCLVIYVIWFFSGKPAITTDYVAELNRIVRPGADESLNAAPFYDQATELQGRLSDEFLLYFAQNRQMIADPNDRASVKELSELARRVTLAFAPGEHKESSVVLQDIQESVYQKVARFLGRIRTDYSALTAGQKDLVDKWVREHNDAIGLVEEGSRLPHCWRKYKSDEGIPSWFVAIQMPDLSEFRELSRALRWRALRRAEQGRHKDAFNDLITLYRFGRHTRTNKLLIEQLVGVALEAIAAGTARDIVGNFQVSSQVLEGFQREFAEIVADEDFSISLDTEKLCVYDEIQRSFTSGSKGHLYLPRFREISHSYGDYTPASGVESLVMSIGEYGPHLFTHPNKEETLETANALYAYYDELVSMTAVERHAEADAIERKLRGFLKGNKLLDNFSPAILRIVEISNRLPMDVSATLTVVAISRYESDKGNYPRDLSQLLADGYLTKLPTDVFADKPLVYRRTDDSFILYSLGPNFQDDAGTPGTNSKGRPRQWADNGDTVFWPLPAQQAKLLQ